MIQPSCVMGSYVIKTSDYNYVHWFQLSDEA